MSKKEWKIEGPFIAHRLDMLISPAWRNAPRAMKALLEEIEVEHMQHKGCANGQLARSYTQFIAAGFNRNTIAVMTRTAEALGFLKVNRESNIGPSDLRDACLYTLTYLPTGIARNIPPTDDWRRIKTDEQALQLVRRSRERRSAASRTGCKARAVA